MRILIKPLALALLAAVVLLPESCKKTTTCNGVPNISVYFTVNVNAATNPSLTTIGGSALFSGGNGEVMVYRYTNDEFNAFDCLCPYEGSSNSKAQVQAQTGGIYAKCPVCGSTFLLSDGSVNKGPATCPLKKYNSTYDGVSTVTVSN